MTVPITSTNAFPPIHGTLRRARRLVVLISTLVLYQCDVSDGGARQGSQDPDPVLVDFPVAYVQRPLLFEDSGELKADNVLDPAAFNPGASLLIKARASVSVEPINISDRAFVAEDTTSDTATDATLNQPLQYDVKDLATNATGDKILFSMRAPEDPDVSEEDQPTWNIWEYDTETDELRRVILSDIEAEQGHDVAPQYLADDSIIFSSNRQRTAKALLLNENKPQFTAVSDDRAFETFNLHTMRDNGEDIQQITFNASHDLQPWLREDGTVLFLRWDNARGQNRLSLYTTDPYGRNVSLYYGYHTQQTTPQTTPTFVEPRTLSNGQTLVSWRARLSQKLGGDILSIDGEQFYDDQQPTPSNAGLTPPGQQSIVNVASDGSAIETTTPSFESQISRNGYYTSAYPLFDGTRRLLVSWSPCLLRGFRLNIFVNDENQLVDENGQFVDTEGVGIQAGFLPVTVDDAFVGDFPCTDSVLQVENIQEAAPLYGIWLFDPRDNSQAPVVLNEQGQMFTDGIVLEPKARPEFIAAPQTGVDVDADQVSNNLGIINIRSVYDIDGEDRSEAGIGTLIDPSLTNPDERPARFIRLIKPVALPTDDFLDFNNSAFGRANGMREIIGYVPIEPDGSALFVAPADIPFSLEVVDQNNQRISAPQPSWLTLRAGENYACRGCHEPDSTLPHGRNDDDFPSANLGADDGVNFANSRLAGAVSAPQGGETMAEYYARQFQPRQPSVDLMFTDEWTNVEAGLTPASAIDLRYANLPVNSTPASDNCQTLWTTNCRITINYLEHIAPLWSVNRQIFDTQTPPNLLEDRTCITCHASLDETGALQIPAGQLELSDAISPDNTNYTTAYDELLFADRPQELVNDALRDVLIPRVDANNDPVFQQDENGELILDDTGQPIQIEDLAPSESPPITPGNARNSTRFFNRFDAGGSHENYLSREELKLLNEWIDIGAQYYNNPFDAP